MDQNNFWVGAVVYYGNIGAKIQGNPTNGWQQEIRYWYHSSVILVVGLESTGEDEKYGKSNMAAGG